MKDRRQGTAVRQRPVNVQRAQLKVAAAQSNSAKKHGSDQGPKAEVLQQLTERVEELMKKVEQLQQPLQTQQPGSCHNCPGKVDQKKAKSYSCAKCLELNRPGCTHCFYCGEEGHRVVGCLK